jgi:hypothetical protein
MELEKLAQNVRDFFLSQYKSKGGSPATSFIAFEPLGHLLSPDDFKLNGQVDATVAAEELSRMCDKVPSVSDIFDADNTRTFSGTYGELISALQFADRNINAPDKKPYLARFGQIKSHADQIYQSQASIENPRDSIFLTRGRPSGWYDPASGIWTRSSISQASVVQTPPTPAPVPAKILWKMDYKPAAGPGGHINQIVRDPEYVQKINAVGVQQHLAAQQSATAMPHLQAMAAIKTPLTATPTAAGASVVSAGASPVLIRANTVPVVSRQTYSAINVALPFSQRVLLNRDFIQVNNLQTQEVKSQNFQMDFNYVFITLERSWLLTDVFDNATLWYALAHKADYYSTGKSSPDNSGALRAIPNAMIVVKDLAITAQWSEEDRRAAVNSLGFGAFNTSHSYFSSTNSNQLIAPGIQVIGWICDVVPRMPVNDDVNMK